MNLVYVVMCLPYNLDCKFTVVKRSEVRGSWGTEWGVMWSEDARDILMMKKNICAKYTRYQKQVECMNVGNNRKTGWMRDIQINFESVTDNGQSLNFEWQEEIILNLFCLPQIKNFRWPSGISVIVNFPLAYVNWNIENNIRYCIIRLFRNPFGMWSVCFGDHWSGKLMEGKENLVGVIKRLKVPFDIVNNRKRDEWILPEQNVDCVLSQSQDAKPVGDRMQTACCHSHKMLNL